MTMFLRFFAAAMILLQPTFIVVVMVDALNGDPAKLTLDTHDGWNAFEVVTQGDTNNDSSYTLPGEIDGIGAYLVPQDDDNSNSLLRILMNHETRRACDPDTEASVTELNLDLPAFHRALASMMIGGNDSLGENDRSFVSDFRRAYDTIVDVDGNEVTALNRTLRLFCSSQAYGPESFGMSGEGFRDQIYIFGEEVKGEPYGRLFAIDSATRRMYQISGATGDASGVQGGTGGIPFDSFENVALIRTFEQNHVALLLSIDGGSGMLKLYIGQKNKNRNGETDTTNFLARNGLAYGSCFYLRGSIPENEGDETNGFFQESSDSALWSEKFEDVDTNPQNPTQVVLAEQKKGVFIFDFQLDFSTGSFQSGETSNSLFSMKMILKPSESVVKEPDNVAWTANDLVYIATDGTNGKIWEMDSSGEGAILIASSKNTANDYNPSGVVDISHFLGYEPSSILLASTMNCGSSLSVLINGAAAVPVTEAPVAAPTTKTPTAPPTRSPTTKTPTAPPTRSPTTKAPTVAPTRSPTTKAPTVAPTKAPATVTTSTPVRAPTKQPVAPAPNSQPAETPTTAAPPLPQPTKPPTAPSQCVFWCTVWSSIRAVVDFLVSGLVSLLQ